MLTPTARPLPMGWASIPLLALLGGGVFFLKDCNCKAGDPQSKWDIPGPSRPLGAFLPGSQFNLQAFLASKGGPKPVNKVRDRIALIGRSLGLFDAATFHFFFPLQNASGQAGPAHRAVAAQPPSLARNA